MCFLFVWCFFPTTPVQYIILMLVKWKLFSKYYSKLFLVQAWELLKLSLFICLCWEVTTYSKPKSHGRHRIWVVLASFGYMIVIQKPLKASSILHRLILAVLRIISQCKFLFNSLVWISESLQAIFFTKKKIIIKVKTAHIRSLMMVIIICIISSLLSRTIITWQCRRLVGSSYFCLETKPIYNIAFLYVIIHGGVKRGRDEEEKG